MVVRLLSPFRQFVLSQSVFFSIKYHYNFRFSFSYSFGRGIFILVLTFLYISVVRLMTKLSMSVKV